FTSFAYTVHMGNLYTPLLAFDVTPLDQATLAQFYKRIPSANGDFNGDGKQDFAALIPSSPVGGTMLFSLFNFGRTAYPTSMAAKVRDSSSEPSARIYVRDVDDDGSDDIVVEGGSENAPAYWVKSALFATN